MIVDSSAILAVLLNEPLGERCLQIMIDSPLKRISAANLLKTATIVDRLPDRKHAAAFDAMIADLEFIIEPVTAEQARVGREARRRYGRGSGHRAHLNFGDCFAYALAKAFDEPLLFIGNDFVHTDLRPALASA
ncbi:MAG: type II toxin-antitoxin system VapC family toxin [Thermomicrobiales bacterium]